MLRITKFMLKDLEIQGLFSFLPKCVRTIFILEASSFSLYLDSSIDCSSLKKGLNFYCNQLLLSKQNHKINPKGEL